MKKSSICLRCEKQFEYQPWDGKGKFCSQICRATPKVTTQCPTCKNEFEYKPTPSLRVRKYCSNKCAVSYDHLSEQKKFEIMKMHFEQNTEPQENGCLIWTGSKFPNGYGRLRFMNKDTLVHRFAYYLYHADLPSNMVVQHSCDQRNCVAKEHLSLGTYKSNSDDCHEKKRHMYGDNHVHAVLTVDQVRQIKQKLKDGISRRLIADQFKIKTGTLTAIALGKTWKHVTLDNQ